MKSGHHSEAAMTETTPNAILAFWLEAGPKNWWGKDDAFDAEIAERFGDIHADAMAGRLDAWPLTANGALALIIVLDQFSRNLFRDDARAFAADHIALAMADAALAESFDHQVENALRAFFYLPFMHSERLADQERCVALFETLAGAEENLKFAIIHRDVIARFGRFPHRNAVLGRTTTPEEQAFLDSGGFAG